MEDGGLLSRCTDGCKNPTPAQAHCKTCHRTFGGVTGFDQHRHKLGHRQVGPMAICLDPGSFGYVERDGVWREPMDHQKVALFNSRVHGKRGREREGTR